MAVSMKASSETASHMVRADIHQMPNVSGKVILSMVFCMVITVKLSTLRVNHMKVVENGHVSGLGKAAYVGGHIRGNFVQGRMEHFGTLTYKNGVDTMVIFGTTSGMGTEHKQLVMSRRCL